MIHESVTTKREITKERYEDWFECLPPLFVDSINGQPVKKAFACSEPYADGPNGIILCVCWLDEDGKYYTGYCEVKRNGHYIRDPYPACYRHVDAETLTFKCPEGHPVERIGDTWHCHTCGTKPYSFHLKKEKEACLQ